MLTPVAGVVVPLTKLPSDLSSFLSGIAGVEPSCWALPQRPARGTDRSARVEESRWSRSSSIRRFPVLRPVTCITAAARRVAP
jgi:hypothetical protein